MNILKVYCAGGDVFLPQADRAITFSNMKKLAVHLSDKLCRLELLIPIDNEIDLEAPIEHAAKQRNALAIRLANEHMIKNCDVVIANLSPFRSEEPDSGTAYECGFARALGKTVLTYTDNLAEQTAKYSHFNFNQTAGDGRFHYTEVEDFALPFNLMMYSDEHPIFENFAQALRYLKKLPENK